MAISTRNNMRVINLHTSGNTELTSEDIHKIELGEIIVRHNESNPELIIKTGDNTVAKFGDKTYVNTQINTLSGNIHTAITGITNDINSINDKVTEIENDYVTSETLNTTLTGYVTSETLNTTLTGYVTSETLNTTLTGYVTSETLNTTLTGYVTSETHNTFVQSTTTKFNEYWTSATTEGKINEAKSELRGEISKIFTYKGTKDHISGLTTDSSSISGEVGCVYSMTHSGVTPNSGMFLEPNKPFQAGMNFVCVEVSSGSYKWDMLGGSVDVSGFATTVNVNALGQRLDDLGIEFGVINMDGTPANATRKQDNVSGTKVERNGDMFKFDFSDFRLDCGEF